MPDNYAAVIVTFFPNEDTLSYLAELPKYCRDVLVIDNTPAPHRVAFPELKNLHVTHLKKNQGLSRGLNWGIEIAASLGNRAVFVFDQDTRVPPNFFANMLQFKKVMDDRYGNCALFVPNFFDRNSETTARFPIISKFSVRHRTCANLETESPRDALIAITSGTLIDYDKFLKIGPFREDYFIDFIDNDYCLRVYRSGFRIAVNCQLIINHAIGQRENRRFLSLSIKPNHHEPVRRYYIARNGIRTAIDNFNSYPSYSLLLLARFVHEILSIILFESNISKKLSSFLQGAVDGFAGRMGPFSNSRRWHI